MPVAKARRSRLTRSARPELAVVLHGALTGHVHQAANRKLVFRYDEAWRCAAIRQPDDPATTRDNSVSLVLQPKTTLYYHGGRWGVPKGRVPSTHILKPPVLDLEDLAYNEHFCLHLARELGMSAASSSVQRFGEAVAIVVERYDRHRSAGAVTRIHQEDMCQALAVQPTRKYQSDGGPTLNDIAMLLARHSSDAMVDIARFLDANILNWLIAGTDGHDGRRRPACSRVAHRRALACRCPGYGAAR